MAGSGILLNSASETERPVYDGDCNPLLLRHITAGSKVLDVGCATGRRGAWLRENRNCYVAGLEVDEKMAASARTRCDSVYQTDIEQLSALPYPESHFDVLVFGDVLEHLRHPELVLVHLLRYLRPGGSVVTSIPNFLFLTVRMKVALGLFRYSEYGILDKTHLRFYTQKTARELVEQCGLQIRTWDYTPPVSGKWEILPDSLRRAMAGVWPSLFAIQFVIVCDRGDASASSRD
jgi:methionine biosynthesis protein MetW